MILFRIRLHIQFFCLLFAISVGLSFARNNEVVFRGHSYGGRHLDQIVISDTLPIPVLSSSDLNIYPERWVDEFQMYALVIEQEEIKRSAVLIKRCLDKYPVRFLLKNLSAVFVLYHVEFKGISAGGTNSSDIVYISNGGKSRGYSDLWVESIFHKEFSSIIFRNYNWALDKMAWEEINEPFFKYGKGGVEAIRNGEASEKETDSNFESGFYSDYAKSGMENDFNAIAGEQVPIS